MLGKSQSYQLFKYAHLIVFSHCALQILDKMLT